MRTSIISRVKSTFTCGRCSMMYLDYKHLLEHLYWRHGTESVWCKKCSVKRWQYAAHVCHVLPIYEIFENDDMSSEDSPDDSERETDYCFCRKFIAEALMIGCDGPNCQIQWYHFSCVGVTTPPEGKWFCPTCDKTKKVYLLKTETETVFSEAVAIRRSHVLPINNEIFEDNDLNSEHSPDNSKRETKFFFQESISLMPR